MPTVAQLSTYPVKSCAGQALDTAEVTATGLAHDRHFMLVRAQDGSMLTQRQLPPMATIRPRVTENRLVCTAPEIEPIDIEITPEGPLREVSVFGTWSGPAVDQGDEIADWFSTKLRRDCRLVRIASTHDRIGSGAITGPITFPDSTALLICAFSSLDLLNDKIVERGGEPLPMNRFRPNIVVSGWPEPHTEDHVRRMRAGTVEIGYAKRCIRCPIPTIDQENGRWNGPEPTRTLARYRTEPEGGVSFGMKAAVLEGGIISVGDRIVVLEKVAA